MATSALSTVANPVSTSSSAAPASTSPSFVWQTVAEMFTCGQTNVRWTFTGSSSPLTLNITNINVTQQAPMSSIGPSSTSQASASAATVSAASLARAKRQFNGFGGSYLPSVNEILIAGTDPAANNFTWTSVNVPQGWYQIYANVQNTVQATSSSFFVQNGTNTNCVPQYAAGAPSISASSSSTSHVPVATVSPGSASSAQSGHSHAGAIAGGVVGGLAFLGVVFAAIFFCFLRRRPSRSRLRDEDGGGRRWSELSFRKFRSGNNARSSTQKPSSNLQAEQTIVGSDEEVSTVGHEKAIAAAQALAHPPSQQPIRSQSLRTSTQTTSSYRDRVTANPERPGSRASYSAYPGEAIPMGSTHLQHSPSVTSPRRKPAPRYDGAAEAGERDGHSSSQTTLDPIHGNSTSGSPDSVHILQHKSSFGAVRPMHVMISDPPASVPP
jgi:hypothetical protein